MMPHTRKELKDRKIQSETRVKKYDKNIEAIDDQIAVLLKYKQKLLAEKSLLLATTETKL